MPKSDPIEVWDAVKRRYVRKSGKVVTPLEQRKIALSVVQKASEEIRDLSVAFTGEKVTLAEYAVEMRALVRNVHASVTQMAFGGKEAMGASERGYLGSIIRTQYSHLSGFINDIENGRVNTAEGIVSRATMYGDAGWSSYEGSVGRREEEAGMSEERSFLDPDADHCEECFDQAAEGWSPIGSLVPIGERTCLVRCRCSLEYR